MRNIQHDIDSVTMSKPHLEHIAHDLFDISGRIRKIDDGYFIVRNHLMHRFEVHHVDNKPTTYAFIVPYDELDCRTLEYCEKTLVEHSARLLREMEENNRRVDAMRNRDFQNKLEGASYQTADELSYAIDQDDLYEGYKKTVGGVSIDK